jgi:hypothetical protein
MHSDCHKTWQDGESFQMDASHFFEEIIDNMFSSNTVHT